MDIHHEVNQILANLEQSHQQLRFEFHSAGATVILCNSAGEHKYEMTPYQLMTLKQLFTFGGDNCVAKMMEARTVAYFTEEPQA